MFNNVILTGRLVARPELKTTQSGLNVTSFTIANKTGYGDKKKTNFINVIAWRGSADFVCNYFDKGQMIGIEGAIQTRSYEDKTGTKRTAFEVVANNVQFVEDKNSDTSRLNVSEGNSSQKGINAVTDDNFAEITDDELPF